MTINSKWFCCNFRGCELKAIRNRSKCDKTYQRLIQKAIIKLLFETFQNTGHSDAYDYVSFAVNFI